MPLSDEEIVVGARSSPLSLAQFEEFKQEVAFHLPSLQLRLRLFSSPGDRDQRSSLRTREKDDFFTRDIDDAVEEGLCRIGLHSAKDLPEKLRPALRVAVLTKGVDSSDSLLLREGLTLENMPENALIATSSERREEAVQALLPKARFCDLRGTIGQRMDLLSKGDVDGIVVAEAALLRLGVTRTRYRLPGQTAPLQGRLAAVIRSCDDELFKLLVLLAPKK